MIAEPATGIRNMIVTQRLTGIAEPIRPPRISAQHRLLPYDMHEAVGNAILAAVHLNEGRSREAVVSKEEEVHFWIELTSQEALSASRIDELWVVVRRFTRADPLMRRKLKASETESGQKKLKDRRVAIVTTSRLVIATLDGNLVWQRPLENIVDTQVSLENKDQLMLGVRNASRENRNQYVATVWMRLHCGNEISRDQLSVAIKNATASKKRLLPTSGAVSYSLFLGAIDPVLDEEAHAGVVDEEALAAGTRGSSMNKLHRDESSKSLTESHASSVGSDRDHEPALDPLLILERVRHAHDKEIRLGVNPNAHRNITMIFANALDCKLKLKEYRLISGSWIRRPRQEMSPSAVEVIDVSSPAGLSQDIRGYFTYEMIEPAKPKEGELGDTMEENIEQDLAQLQLDDNDFGLREGHQMWKNQAQG